MRTDIPLKRLTMLRASDLLPLLGTPDATVLGVMTLELPTTATSLDTVLRLRSPNDQEYLHLIEWQGYRDPTLLWRTLGYLAWLGKHRRERPILVTVIYLTPEDDVGETLRQELAGQAGWAVTLPCVRLWQQDAEAALASETPGLAALSPLMGNATTASVEQAIAIITAQAPEAQQDELLTVLGVFAERLIAPERFIGLVTKERLMATDLISYLLQEKTADLEQRVVTLEQTLRQTLIDVIAARFPQAPITLAQRIQQLSDPPTVQRLITAAAQTSDLAEIERLIGEAARLREH